MHIGIKEEVCCNFVFIDFLYNLRLKRSALYFRKIFN